MPSSVVDYNLPSLQGTGLLVHVRHDHIAQTHVLLKVSVMGHTARHAHQEDEVHLLEGAQKTGRRVAGRCHRLTRTPHRRQFGAHNAMRSDVAQGVHVGLA